MRVAAIYDLHGNLPELEAVLQDIRQAKVDHVVVGGDVVPGPMPRETLKRLLDLGIPVQFIQGHRNSASVVQDNLLGSNGSSDHFGWLRKESPKAISKKGQNAK